MTTKPREHPQGSALGSFAAGDTILTSTPFRHTAADGWLANGATLAEVQALLGHANIGTTGIYTKVRSETLAAVVKAGRFETTLSSS